MISGVANSGMCPFLVLRSASVGMRLSGSPRIFSRPKGSFGPSAKDRMDWRAAVVRRLPMMVVALFDGGHFVMGEKGEEERERDVIELS